MATKAEWFRYESERAGAKRPRSGSRRHGRGDGTGESAHNVSARAAKKATYVLEAAPGARPSRKSSRKSANRQKTDTQFRMKRAAGEARPETRVRPGR